MSASGKHHSRRQRGFGLVEIMIALVLGLLLSAAAIQVFLGSKASYNYNEALSSLQDNARFALHVLKRDLRMAGYTGCLSPLTTAQSVVTDSSNAYGRINVNGQVGISEQDVLENHVREPASGDLPDDSSGDALRIGYMKDYGVRLTSTGSKTSLPVKQTPASWGENEILLVTDCQQADLFKVASASQSSIGVAGSSLSKTYNESDRVFEPYAVRYYVAETSDKDEAGEHIKALYRRRVLPMDGSGGDALVTGITNLTIRYGVDTSGDGSVDAYRKGDSVSAANWPDVLAVRVGFVAVSESRAGAATNTQASSLQLFDNTVSDIPDDGYLRRAFTTTIALRNRLFR